MSLSSSVGSLDIIFEDDHMVAVNKAANMLSVPGKTRPRLPRQVEWTLATEKAGEIAPERFKDALSRMSTHHNVPRKEEQFVRFMKRTYKIDDDALCREAYTLVQKVDNEMHHILPLTDIPEGWVSVTEYIEHRLNAKINVVHRLDQATSGVFLMAKTSAAAQSLCSQFRDRTTSKTYVCEVDGSFPENVTKVMLKLRADADDKPKQVIDEERGRPCETLVRVIERKEKSTFVELVPITGRTHQLRMHMLGVGHPILGDGLYANEDVAKALPRLALHARTLEVNHPVTGEKVILEAPLDDFRGPQSLYVPFPCDEEKDSQYKKRKRELAG